MTEIIKTNNNVNVMDVDNIDSRYGTYIMKRKNEYFVLAYNGEGKLSWGKLNRTDGIAGPFGVGLLGIKEAINWALDSGYKVYQFNSIDEALKAGLK